MITAPSLVLRNLQQYMLKHQLMSFSMFQHGNVLYILWKQISVKIFVTLPVTMHLILFSGLFFIQVVHAHCHSAASQKPPCLMEYSFSTSDIPVGSMFTTTVNFANT